MNITRCAVEMCDEDIYIVRVSKDDIQSDPDIHALVHTLNVLKTQHRGKGR